MIQTKINDCSNIVILIIGFFFNFLKKEEIKFNKSFLIKLKKN